MQEINQCNQKQIIQSINSCQYVIQYCQDYQQINFTEFYFCTINENVLVLDILTIFVPLLSFQILSSTSEIYLSASLQKISNFFKFSQTFTAITILAFGNGAPDIFTALIAGKSQNGGINMIIGSIFGAGLFVTTITLSKVIQNAKRIKIDQKIFLRDILFYIFAQLIILFYTFIGKVTWYMSSLFISLYI
ncbi:sodium calcium exchanger protein, putative, partial [Ichthyophthirius multifiliis]